MNEKTYFSILAILRDNPNAIFESGHLQTVPKYDYIDDKEIGTETTIKLIYSEPKCVEEEIEEEIEDSCGFEIGDKVKVLKDQFWMLFGEGEKNKVYEIDDFMRSRTTGKREAVKLKEGGVVDFEDIELVVDKSKSFNEFIKGLSNELNVSEEELIKEFETVGHVSRFLQKEELCKKRVRITNPKYQLHSPETIYEIVECLKVGADNKTVFKLENDVVVAPEDVELVYSGPDPRDYFMEDDQIQVIDEDSEYHWRTGTICNFPEVGSNGYHMVLVVLSQTDCPLFDMKQIKLTHRDPKKFEIGDIVKVRLGDNVFKGEISSGTIMDGNQFSFSVYNENLSMGEMKIDNIEAHNMILLKKRDEPLVKEESFAVGDSVFFQDRQAVISEVKDDHVLLLCMGENLAVAKTEIKKVPDKPKPEFKKGDKAFARLNKIQYHVTIATDGEYEQGEYYYDIESDDPVGEMNVVHVRESLLTER